MMVRADLSDHRNAIEKPACSTHRHTQIHRYSDRRTLHIHLSVRAVARPGEARRRSQIFITIHTHETYSPDFNGHSTGTRRLRIHLRSSSLHVNR